MANQTRRQLRAAFERWVTSPPYEKRVERGGPDSPWPGQYRAIDVQLAWEAWQEATVRRDAHRTCDVKPSPTRIAVRV